METPDNDEVPDAPRSADERRALLEGLRAATMKKVRIEALTASWKRGPLPGADAARSQDFLYDESGLPVGGGDFSLTDITPALPKS